MDTTTINEIIYWNDLDGAMLLNKVFTYPVKIEKVDIFNFSADRNATEFFIDFDMVEHVPDNPPIKWGRDFNKCRLGLSCIGVTELTVKGLSGIMLADIKIWQGGYIHVTGDEFSIKLKCKHIQLHGPRVYSDG